MTPLPISVISPRVDIFADKTHAAAAAAAAAAVIIRSCIKSRQRARIMVGTGNSQVEMIGFLAREPGIDWSQVEAFHLDEYVGIAENHPAAFRHWIRQRFVELVHPKSIHYLEGDAPNLRAMTEHYSRLLLAAPIDLAFVGIGENGHVAFNDPHAADFADTAIVKCVTLDAACRQQQVGEGHFPSLASVPREAVTVTCPGLVRAEHWICCVPDGRKAQAIQGALEGPVSTACPGSLVQSHPDAAIFLDADSAALLSPGYIAGRCRWHTSNEAI